MSVGAYRHDHPDTSKEAAHSISSVTKRDEDRVLHFLRECKSHGATDHEMQAGLELDPSTQRPRRRQLVLDGKVEYAGKKRLTPSGRRAQVWVVTTKGLWG